VRSRLALGESLNPPLRAKASPCTSGMIHGLDGFTWALPYCIDVSYASLDLRFPLSAALSVPGRPLLRAPWTGKHSHAASPHQSPASYQAVSLLCDAATKQGRMSSLEEMGMVPPDAEGEVWGPS
jgi:hypothetical protein